MEFHGRLVARRESRLPKITQSEVCERVPRTRAMYRHNIRDNKQAPYRTYRQSPETIHGAITAGRHRDEITAFVEGSQ